MTNPQIVYEAIAQTACIGMGGRPQDISLQLFREEKDAENYILKIKESNKHWYMEYEKIKVVARTIF